MSDCIFCKIIEGKIPSYKLYEDKNFIVILDRFPSALGHTLIIPKVHVRDIFELDPELAGELFSLATKIAKALKATVNPEGLNILQNNGAVASQTVMHFHMHLIPRYSDDKICISWQNLDPSESDFQKILEKFMEFV